MSTPYNGGGYEPYPEHPRGSHPENDPYPYPSQKQYPSQNQYPTGYDAFEVNTAASAAGAGALRFHGQQLTDNVPGDGLSPHPINDPASNGWFHVKGDGKVHVFDALGWGFKAEFGNAKLWIPLGIIYALLVIAPMTAPAIGVLTPIATLLFVPWLTGVALQQTLARTVTYSDAKAPAYGKTLGVAVVLGLLLSVVMTILIMLLAAGALSTIDLDSLPDPNNVDEDPEAAWDFLRPLLGAFAVAGVVSMLAGPFFVMQTWYAADNNGSFGDAFAAGFKAGASNYLPLLGLFVLLILLNLLGALLFCLGLIVTVPASLLALAYAYRELSGGPLPKGL